MSIVQVGDGKGSHVPQELAATERAEVLEKENRRLREALAESRDGAETEAQYRLYKQRVEQEKELRELRER